MIFSKKTSFDLFGKQTRQLMLALIITTICYLLLQNIFVYPAFLFFNVLLSLQSTRRLTIDVSLQRILGSILGSVLGLTIIFLVPANYLLLCLPFALGFATYLSYVSMNAFVPITLIISLMMMTDHYDSDMFYYAFQRVLAACVGVSISLFTSYVYRSKTLSYQERFIKIASKLLEKFNTQFNVFLEIGYIDAKKQTKLIDDIQKLRVIREKISHEQVFFFKENQFYLEIIQLFADYYMNLQLLVKVQTVDSKLYQYHLTEIEVCKQQLYQKLQKKQFINK